MDDTHTSSAKATAPSGDSASFDSPEPVTEMKSAASSMREWLLAFIAIVSLSINGLLAYQKFNQDAVAQPGPHIARVVMNGLDAAALQELSRSTDILTTTFGKSVFLNTPSWTAFREEQRRLPPIALRNQEVRFLLLQNLTASAYEKVSLRNGDSLIADVGTVHPDSSVLLYYAGETSVESARLTYVVKGSSAENQLAIPRQPRDSVEFTTRLSGVSISRFGSLPDKTDRLNSLLEILERRPN
ncbi:hypothetical protein [Falsiroseomonas sp. E2-1-a20]|uniref:hypothetical protein n=1 Tax=Falsiroseomonas sp. E2-1-a20 TaxID=3239300 RepID=UPI003F306292